MISLYKRRCSGSRKKAVRVNSLRNIREHNVPKRLILVVAGWISPYIFSSPNLSAISQLTGTAMHIEGPTTFHCWVLEEW